MSTPAILNELIRAGATVRRDGDKVKIKGADVIPVELLERARAERAAILAALPDTPTTTELRRRLADLCRREGLPDRLAATLIDADLVGCELLSDEGLRRWLHVLDENRRMRQGLTPPGWMQASYCRRCGPVLLWQGAPPVVLGCPWCHMRRIGGHLPRPAVTCATCAHQQRRADTSTAGMHGCAKGNALHHAHQQHVCADWAPVLSTANNSAGARP